MFTKVVRHTIQSALFYQVVSHIGSPKWLPFWLTTSFTLLWCTKRWFTHWFTKRFTTQFTTKLEHTITFTIIGLKYLPYASFRLHTCVKHNANVCAHNSHANGLYLAANRYCTKAPQQALTTKLLHQLVEGCQIQYLLPQVPPPPLILHTRFQQWKTPRFPQPQAHV